LPLFIRSPSEFEKAWNVEAPYLKAAYAKKNVLILGHYAFPYNVLWSRKKMTALADIAGQKIRVVSPEQAALIQRLGGIPVTLGPAEVAAALDRGVIDGVITASSGYGYIWRDLLKYRYSLNVSYIDALLLVNKDAWNDLSPDNRAKVQAVVDRGTQAITSGLAKEEDTLTTQLGSSGITVTTPTPADLAQAEKLMIPYWEAWAKARGGAAPEAMQKVRAAIGR
jgi:TRAP-type C4-dicarboxylate transport system substrate-binding protein